jgi:hypothetical protein
MRDNRDRLPRMSIACTPAPPGGSSWQVTTEGVGALVKRLPSNNSGHLV